MALIPVALTFAGCGSREDKIQKLIARVYEQPTYEISTRHDTLGATNFIFASSDTKLAVASLKGIGEPAVPFLLNAIALDSPFFKNLKRKATSEFTGGKEERTYLTLDPTGSTFIGRIAEILGEIKREGKGTSNAPILSQAMSERGNGPN